jgi:hypothetical protein
VCLSVFLFLSFCVCVLLQLWFFVSSWGSSVFGWFFFCLLHQE